MNFAIHWVLLLIPCTVFHDRNRVADYVSYHPFAFEVWLTSTIKVLPLLLPCKTHDAKDQGSLLTQYLLLRDILAGFHNIWTSETASRAILEADGNKARQMKRFQFITDLFAYAFRICDEFLLPHDQGRSSLRGILSVTFADRLPPL